MTAPVFVVEPDALAAAGVGSTVRLDGAEGRHAVSVRRLAPGEPVDLVDGRGRRVRGVVSAIVDRQAVDVTVQGVEDEAPSIPWITVVQALPKGDRGELAVELLTEVGVDEIVPWAAQHSVTRWSADRAERGQRRWSDTLTAAAKQARRAQFPVLAPLAATADVVTRIAAVDVALVLHEAAPVRMPDVGIAGARTILLIVGPEGGLTADEVSAFTAAGARVVRLGPTILRTSSAGMAAAAVLLAASGRWGQSGGSTGAEAAGSTGMEG